MSRVLALALLALTLSACPKTARRPDAPPKPEAGVREDRNRDGRSDVWFEKADAGIRKKIDLDYDGRVDLIQLVDDDGRALREERDLDYDGRVDHVVVFEAGLPTVEETGFGFDGRFHHRIYFESGKRVREEIDVDQDGRIDEWRYFENEKLVRVGEDLDHDGKPETFRR